ncbi:hypothetical protein [Streptomyces sp. bgisy027]
MTAALEDPARQVRLGAAKVLGGAGAVDDPDADVRAYAGRAMR